MTRMGTLSSRRAEKSSAACNESGADGGTDSHAEDRRLTVRAGVPVWVTVHVLRISSSAAQFFQDVIPCQRIGSRSPANHFRHTDSAGTTAATANGSRDGDTQLSRQFGHVACTGHLFWLILVPECQAKQAKLDLSDHHTLPRMRHTCLPSKTQKHETRVTFPRFIHPLMPAAPSTASTHVSHSRPGPA